MRLRTPSLAFAFAAVAAASLAVGCGAGAKSEPPAAADPDAAGGGGPDAGVDHQVPPPPAADAGTFVDASSSTAVQAGNLYAVTVTGPDDVWIAADNGVVHLSAGGTTLALSSENSSFASFYGIWADSPADVYAVGEYAGESTFIGVIQHWDGTTWTDESAQVPMSNYFYAAWGSGPSDVWAVGNIISGNALAASVFHYDGSGWKSSLVETSMQDFSGVWGSGPTDVWAAGFGGLFHFDGTSWKQVTPTNTNLSIFGRIWGSGSSDAWTTGSELGDTTEALFHWNGSAWSVGYTPPASLGIANVWEASPDDVWTVGAITETDAGFNTVTGTTLHFDGTAWSTVPSGTTKSQLNAIGGHGAGNVWAVGDQGTILHLQ